MVLQDVVDTPGVWPDWWVHQVGMVWPDVVGTPSGSADVVGTPGGGADMVGTPGGGGDPGD